MLMSFETITKQRSGIGAAGRNGLNDRNVAECGFWAESVSVIPWWPAVWSDRFQRPSCSLCPLPSGLSGRGS